MNSVENFIEMVLYFMRIIRPSKQFSQLIEKISQKSQKYIFDEIVFVYFNMITK